MNTITEHMALHAALESSARLMRGSWAALASAGYFGLASFAMWEAKERQERADKVAAHLIVNGIAVDLPVIDSPLCEYATPIAAIEAMLVADEESMAAARHLVTAMTDSGENPYFQARMLPGMEKDMDEIREVISKTKATNDKAEMMDLNTELLLKYPDNE